MNRFLEEVLAMKDELVENRRYLHENPELGFDLENTINFVERKLKDYGLNPQRVGKGGITASLGQGSPVILLRGDMDALPMTEESGEAFASKNGATHACGHDTHTTMLLAAAKVLKAHEDELEGTVKFMFQPAEEILEGAKDMIANGILENPKVDLAFGQHIFAGGPGLKAGKIYYTKNEASTSADAFTIKVFGKQAHGSMPNEGIDAVLIACYIAIGLQTIIAREVSSSEKVVVIVGKIDGGATVNTTGGYAELQVSMRTINKEIRPFVKKRIKEIATGIGETYRAKVEVIETMTTPSLDNDPKYTDDFVGYAKDLVGEEGVIEVPPLPGSEDFAYVSEQVPTVFFQLGGGAREDGYEFTNHSPKFRIDEEALPIGAALYCQLAYEYLKNEGK